MKLMKAIQISAPGAEFELVNVPVPEPKENEVLIKIQACGICHGDAIAKEGHYPGIKYPVIPGHEVIGTIAKIGSNIEHWKEGQRVGVGWHGGHCFKCNACRRGDFWACEKSVITGLTTNGGYAEYMTARQEVLVSIPDEMNSIDSAPLLCAGRTTFGALKNCGAKGGDLVAIHGLGGLGHLAVQYAVKLGFRTVVISHSRKKEVWAHKLGAHAYIDTNDTDAAKVLIRMGGARVILCTAPNGNAISALVGGLGHNGQIIIVTGTSDVLHIPSFHLLSGGRSVGGWLGGSVEEALDFSLLAKIVPMVEVFPLEDVAIAFKKMMDSKVHFRAVLKIS